MYHQAELLYPPGNLLALVHMWVLCKLALPDTEPELAVYKLLSAEAHMCPSQHSQHIQAQEPYYV
jgi:hypothetical protein